MLKNVKRKANGQYTVRICKGPRNERFRKQFSADTVRQLEEQVIAYLQTNPDLVPEVTNPNLYPTLVAMRTPSELVTLGEVILEFLLEKKVRTSAKTLEHYKNRLVRWGEWFGETPIREFNPGHVNAYIKRRKEGGDCHANTISREIVDMNCLGLFAVEHGYLEKPWKFKTLPREGRLKPVRIVTVEELEAILAHCTYDVAAMAIRFMRYCGLRKAEALNMRHSWLNQADVTLTIPSGDEFKTKTRKARTIPVPTVMFEFYRKVPQQSLCFVHPSAENPGKPINDPKFYIRQACRKAGVAPFSCHDLRHSYAQQMAEAGVHPTFIAAILGHTTTRMTNEVYTRARDHNLADAVKAVFSPLDQLLVAQSHRVHQNGHR